MATASRRARKTSRHSHWPTATGQPSEAKVLPGPANDHRGRPSCREPHYHSQTPHAATGRRAVPRPGRPRRSRRRPDPHAQPGAARHAQRRQPAIGRTTVPAARGHAVPHPRRAVLTHGGRPRRRPLAARKRGNPRPHPETERSVRGPAAPTTQVCKHPFGGGGYPAGQAEWLAGLVALRDRPSASRRALPPLRMSVACCWASDGIPDRGVLLLVVGARVRGLAVSCGRRSRAGRVTAGSGRLREYRGRWCVSGRVRRGGRSWRSRFIWAVPRRDTAR
jgi:hypothetical protein